MIDLAVIGGGLAGMSTALRARELGLSVALIEKGSGDDYECNTRYSGGNFHLAHSPANTSADDHMAKIEAITEGFVAPELSRLLATRGSEAVDWLATSGAAFQGRGDSAAWQASVLMPVGEQGPGLTWRGRGPDKTLHLLSDQLTGAGGQMLSGHEVNELLANRGHAWVVRTVGPGGRANIEARSVVLADGGFQANRELVKQYICPDPSLLRLRGATGSVGSGLRFAEAAGAALVSVHTFYGCLLSRDALSNDGLWPYPMLDYLAINGILVNSNGQRFADEGRGGTYLANCTARLSNPSSAVVISDQRGWDTAGRQGLFPTNPNLERQGGTVFRGAYVDELAHQTRLPPDILRDTIATFNRAVHAGKAHNLDVPRTTPSRLLLSDPFYAAPRPIEAPFYAVPVAVGITYTTGGPKVDEHLRVIGLDGAPIRMLYAAGATAGGFEGGPAAGYIGGLMRALTTGYVVAETVKRDLKATRDTALA